MHQHGRHFIVLGRNMGRRVLLKLKTEREKRLVNVKMTSLKTFVRREKRLKMLIRSTSLSRRQNNVGITKPTLIQSGNNVDLLILTERL